MAEWEFKSRFSGSKVFNVFIGCCFAALEPGAGQIHDNC